MNEIQSEPSSPRLHQRILAIALMLLIAEVLSFTISTNGWQSEKWTRDMTRYAIGFPMPALYYTSESDTGVIPEGQHLPEEDEWQAGFGVDSFALNIDCFTTVLIVGLLATFLKTHTTSLSAGMVVGLAVGAALDALHSIRLPFQGDFAWLPLLVIVIPVPLGIAWWTRDAAPPKSARIAMVIGVMLVVSASSRLVDRCFERHIDGGDVRWIEAVGSSFLVGALLLGFSTLFSRWIRKRVSAASP